MGGIFGDRYKSVLIVFSGRDGTGGDLYLQALLDCIHLNPVRAGLMPTESSRGLLDYPFSSFVQVASVVPDRLHHSRPMPFVTSFERLAPKEGRQESILEILESRFGDVPAAVRERTNALCDEPKLKELQRRASVIPTLG